MRVRAHSLELKNGVADRDLDDRKRTAGRPLMKALESNDFSSCVDQIAAEDDIQSVIVLANRNTEPCHRDERERHRIQKCETSAGEPLSFFIIALPPRSRKAF